MAYWEDFLRDKLLDSLSASKFAAYTGEILLGASGLGSLAKLAYSVYDIFSSNKKRNTELERQNDLRMKMEQAQTERLALMRERNYARHSAYVQQTQYGLSAMDHATVASGLSIYSGEAQYNKQQYIRNRSRMEYLTLMGEA